MQFVKHKSRLREDAVIGLVFTALFALGLLMASIWPTSVSIQTIVLGNILAISDEDVVQVAVIAAVSLVILMLIWKDLMVTFFDESHARTIGIRTGALKIVFFTLLSACTVAALQTVGACLVIAMVVTPGATAYLLTDRFGRLIAISVALGVVTSFVGAYLSYFLDGATGGVIVTLQTLAVPCGLHLRACARPSCRAPPPHCRGRGRGMNTLIEWITLPLSYPVHAACAGGVGAGRGGLRGAVLLSGAEGLVADGGRDLARRAARHCDRPCTRAAARHRRLRRGPSPARCLPAI